MPRQSENILDLHSENFGLKDEILLRDGATFPIPASRIV